MCWVFFFLSLLHFLQIVQDFILRLWSEVTIQASTKTHARVHVESVAGSDWAARCMACDIHGEWDQLWKMNMHFMLV